MRRKSARGKISSFSHASSSCGGTPKNCAHSARLNQFVSSSNPTRAVENELGFNTPWGPSQPQSSRTFLHFAQRGIVTPLAGRAEHGRDHTARDRHEAP